MDSTAVSTNVDFMNKSNIFSFLGSVKFLDFDCSSDLFYDFFILYIHLGQQQKKISKEKRQQKTAPQFDRLKENQDTTEIVNIIIIIIWILRDKVQLPHIKNIASC